MTVRDMLIALQTLPRDAELLAFEAGCEDYCEREVDEVEWQGGRVYLHLGARRDARREARRRVAALVRGRPVQIGRLRSGSGGRWEQGPAAASRLSPWSWLSRTASIAARSAAATPGRSACGS
jgi:hypothetical protein